MYVVAVEIRLQPGQREIFLPLMIANARASRETEPHCHGFDVCTDPEQPDQVFLYETYTDASGFAAHLQTAHFKSFEAATTAMIAEKTLRILTRAAP